MAFMGPFHYKAVMHFFINNVRQYDVGHIVHTAIAVCTIDIII